MKHFRSLAALATVALTAGLSACGDAVTASEQPRIALTDADLESVIVAQGFRADMIQDFGSYYLVEGDISFPKETLRQMAGTGPLFQYTTTNLVSLANVGQIRVDLSGLASNSDWLSAARDALGAWRGIDGSYVYMTESSTSPHISVSTECRNDNVLGRIVNWPSNGLPGSVVYVNTCWRVNNVNVTPSQGARQHTVIHELGHTIGMRHANWNQVDCNGPCGGNAGPEGANLVSGTPTSGNDPNSVMQGGVAGTAWAGFTAGDLTAARSRYPVPYASQIWNTVQSGNVVVNWQPVTGASYYEVRRYEYSTHSWGGSSSMYGAWQAVYGTSFATDNAYTGASECTYTDNGPNPNSDYFYWQVRVIHSNGKVSSENSVAAPDAVC